MENEGKKGSEFRIALSREKASSLCVLCVCLCVLCVCVFSSLFSERMKKKSGHSALIPPAFLGGWSLSRRRHGGGIRGEAPLNIHGRTICLPVTPYLKKLFSF